MGQVGKLKNKLIEIEDIIGSVYIYEDFHSPETLKDAVYKAMKENDIDPYFKTYVDEKLQELIESE